MKKAIILDVDGTLVDTNYLHVEAWAQALAEIGRPVPRSVIHKQIGKGGDQFLPVFVEDEQKAKRADALHGEIYEKLERHGQPLPGAKALLAALAKQGYALWIGSSAKPEELERHLKALDASDKIAGRVDKSDVERSKPHPDIFIKALEKAGCRPEWAIVLGDTIWDIQAARGAGLEAVMVLTGGGYSRQELERAGAKAVLDDCDALLRAGFPEL
jgi:HAD superfamily hydrolase (TIGR01509 family)